MSEFNKYAVFDLETLKPLFSAGFRNYITGERKTFIVSAEKNELPELLKFLRATNRHGWLLVGYNCLGFDGQILEFLIEEYDRLIYGCTNEEIIEEIYNLSQKIINLPEEEKFLQLLPEWKLSLRYIDLMKQLHYDSRAKKTSLKWLQFTMRFHNIESMPVEHHEMFHPNRIPEVIGYMDNDVDSTLELFKKVKFETELRQQLSKEYDLNLINASEPRMAREIFGKILSEAMGMSYRDLKELRTYRNRIYGSQVIFPYIHFRDPVLNGAKDFFNGLDFNPYEFSDNNYGIKEVTKTFKFHNINGDIGLGGLHACVNPGVYDEIPDELTIFDDDVASYYPNLGIENNLFPQHLSSTFCYVTKELFEMRKKIDKKNPINYIFKIILNSAYGLSKELNNYFHDPKYTFAITINGQLLLLRLGEMLRDAVPDIKFLQFNTDGITYMAHPKHEKTIQKVREEWMKMTKLELESNKYKKMVIMDVNNYIAIDQKDKVKRKGLFGYSMKPEDREMAYHKNPSELIVPKALEAFFIHGVPCEDYIRSSEDIFDFCSGVKIKRDFDLMEYSYNIDENRIDKKKLKESVVRYYVTTETTSLKKKYKPGSKMGDKNAKPGMKKGKKAGEPGVVELRSGWNTKYFNVYSKKPMEEYNLNYKYYIAAAKKIVDAIIPHATNLTLDF